MLQPPTIHSAELLAPEGATPAAQPADSRAVATPGQDPVLCRHCGRTASNGISCEGYCVADSGY
jgi:hypothetical protein